MELDQLVAELDGIRIEQNEKIIQQKSRDFYWYSPVLKERLDHVTGDLVVTPRNEEDVIRTLKACYRHNVPVTPRGAGTGNYGQAMPLSGGVVLNLSEMKEIHSISPGRAICGPGIVCADLDKAARAHSGQEMRMHPSTYHTATIGGFIAGGSGGVGSINWGGLRDFGNVIRLRVVTMEEEPRVLELTGEDLHKVTHAYGTNGIITEIEIPLAPSYDWIDMILSFATFDEAAAYANSLARQDGILTKLITVVAAPAPENFFKRHARFLTEGESVVMVMVAPHSHDALNAHRRRMNGKIAFDASKEISIKGLPPVFELAWNHTTLRALRIDPVWTYLQTLYPFPNQLELVSEMDSAFPGEMISHLEFVRFDGDVTCFGLPLVRYTNEARLDAIVDHHNRNGSPVFNPHRFTLEEGGMKQTDEIQLAFKRKADPKGLLNPGKMIAWDDPAYDFNSGQVWLFRGLQKAG